MSTSDYEIHIERNRYNSLWDDDSEDFPFGEDLEDIDRAIEEELGVPKRRKKRRKGF